MEYLSQYIIQFKNLSQGKHKFLFRIDKKFFDCFDYGEFDDVDLTVDVDFIVQKKGFLIKFHIFGTVNVMCDRCLENFDMAYETNRVLNVEFGDETTNEFEYDDNITIARDETQINLAKHIYDFILLGLPAKKVHPDDENGNPTCNIKMLELLEKYRPKTNLANQLDLDNLKQMLN